MEGKGEQRRSRQAQKETKRGGSEAKKQDSLMTQHMH